MSTPDEVARDLVALTVQVPAKIHAVTIAWTASLQRQVQANASGRPGPNAPTGNYRRSINRQTRRTARGSEGQVGTNQPQGWRLEAGFTGTDALGRNYNQPAFPHFGPALDFVGAGYQNAIAAAGLPGAGSQIRSIA